MLRKLCQACNFLVPGPPLRIEAFFKRSASTFRGRGGREKSHKQLKRNAAFWIRVCEEYSGILLTCKLEWKPIISTVCMQIEQELKGSELQKCGRCFTLMKFTKKIHKHFAMILKDNRRTESLCLCLCCTSTQFLEPLVCRI